MRKNIQKVLLILLIAIFLTACSEEVPLEDAEAIRQTPFEGLFYQQTRDDVRILLGTPDTDQYEYEHVKYTWNIDEYEDVAFLGTSGRLSVWYDSENLVSHAFWNCTLDYSEYITYEEEMIDYFTSTYGIPSDGYYMYNWELNGAEIGYSPESKTKGLTPESATIQLHWQSFYVETTTESEDHIISQSAYSTEDVKKKLVGLWLAQTDYGGFGYIFRDDNTVLKSSLLGSTTLPDVTGTFEIMDNGKIKCVNSSGNSTMYLDYTFQNNQLRLYEDGIELTKD